MFDIYELALKRLRADKRPLIEIQRAVRLPYSTLSDIKRGICKSPGLKTLRKIAQHYGNGVA